MSIKNSSVEKIMIGMRVDEEALQPFHEPEVDIAVDPAIVVWHPKIAVHLMEPEDPVVAHAIVLWQDDLDMISPDRQLVGESLDHVAQTTHLGHRCTFRAGHHNIHR